MFLSFFDMSLGSLVMFLKRKKSQRFGASSFSKFHHTPEKSRCHPKDGPTASKKITLQ